MKRVIILIILFMIFNSCSDNKIIEPENEITEVNYFPIKVGNLWEYQTSYSTGDYYLFTTLNTEEIEITKVLNDSSFSFVCTFSGVKTVTLLPISSYNDIDTTSQYNNLKCSLDVEIRNRQFIISNYYNCSNSEHPLISNILSKIDLPKNNVDTLVVDYDTNWVKVNYTLIKNIGLTDFYHNDYALNGPKVYKCKLTNYTFK